MSTKPETTFYLSIHRHLPDSVYAVKMNNPYVGGIPDCWYSGESADLWVEYKFVVVPKRKDTEVEIGLSELQRKWIRDRHREGRNLAVCVGCEDGGVWLWGQAGTDVTLTAAAFATPLLKTRKELAEIIRNYVS